MKVRSLFLSLILSSSLITVTAQARDWDQCIGHLRSTGAEVNITSSFSDGLPQSIHVEVYSSSAILDFEGYINVAQHETAAARIYEGISRSGHFVLTIQASSCTRGSAPLRCAGVAQFAALDGGASIPVTCAVNIPYTPAVGSHRP